MLFKLAALVSFRDRYDLLKAKAPEEASAWVRAVSYTHLDVYKRQA